MLLSVLNSGGKLGFVLCAGIRALNWICALSWDSNRELGFEL